MNTQNMPDDVGRYSLVIEWSDEDGLYEEDAADARRRAEGTHFGTPVSATS